MDGKVLTFLFSMRRPKLGYFGWLQLVVNLIREIRLKVISDVQSLQINDLGLAGAKKSSNDLSKSPKMTSPRPDQDLTPMSAISLYDAAAAHRSMTSQKVQRSLFGNLGGLSAYWLARSFKLQLHTPPSHPERQTRPLTTRIKNLVIHFPLISLSSSPSSASRFLLLQLHALLHQI